MNRVHLFHNTEAMMQHIGLPGYLECPERLVGIETALATHKMVEKCISHKVTKPLPRSTFVKAYGEATVKAWEYGVNAAIREKHPVIDERCGDIYWSAGTMHAVGIAAAAAVTAVQTVLAAPAVEHAFAIVRPPGHHCFDLPLGFCIANNVALAADVALAAGKRVAIVDWDYHFGDGTAETFLDNPNVSFVSLHCKNTRTGFPTYPSHPLKGDSLATKTYGRCFNIQWDHDDADDSAYLCAFEEVIVPAFRRFAPDIVLVSAGYDAIAGDDLAGMELSSGVFAHLTRMLRSLDKPVVCVLEGGYNPTLLGKGVVETLNGLLYDNEFDLEYAAHIKHIRVCKAVRDKIALA